MEFKKEIYGLKESDIKNKIERYGYNTIEEKKKISRIKIFLTQFNDIIIWVLLAATLISLLMGEWADSISIIIIVIINAFLGFLQEYKTEKSLEALKAMASPTAKIIREGKISVINSKFIVPDDIFILEAGDRIPADGILLYGNNLIVDEALLTGESNGVEKSLKGSSKEVYMGTNVLKGKAYIKTSKIGMKTEMGKIAHMLQDIKEESSPLKDKLNELGKILVVLCITICFIVTILGMIRGQNIYEMFLLGVSLAVAAIPEGLAAIVTVSLALGVSKMLKRKALVRKLPAVETLGETSIICSDKTGTLTENHMKVVEFYIDNKAQSQCNNIILKKCICYCNDCNVSDKELMGDPTEIALIRSFFYDSKEYNDFLAFGKRVYDLPFDSERKIMSTIVNENNKNTLYVKGAPEKILKKSTHIIINGIILELTNEKRIRLEDVIEKMSLRALRCIATAFKSVEGSCNNIKEENLIFIGIVGMIDPPRKEVKSSVLTCKMAGITPIMITGDHKNTAFSIGRELNICDSLEQVITGEELDKLNDNELKSKIKEITVFARVNPKHKLRVVRAFKSVDKVVAMTGDGVNDAPAVKEADIGIAMGITGTDVTKEASSMILLDDNFSTIVSAVEEGRKIYRNIRKFIRYLLSCNLGEVFTMLLAAIFYLDTPLIPIQILLINLATDGLPAMALGVDPVDEDIMLEKPRLKSEGVFSRGLSEKIIIRGALIGTCTILSFLTAKYYGMSLNACRTIALSTLILSQLIHVFECKSEKYSLFEIHIFNNLYLVFAVLISIILLILVLYLPFFQSIFHTVPLGFSQFTIVFLFSGIIALINSVYLLIQRK